MYEILKNGIPEKAAYDSIVPARTKMREIYNKLDKKYSGTPRFIGSNSAAIMLPYGLLHIEIVSWD